MDKKTTLMEILTSGTPLSLELVRESWPHLSMEEKRTILSTQFLYREHLGRVLDIALSDQNPVIRWMASNHVSKPDEHTPKQVLSGEQARWEKVQSDSVSFVRHPWREVPWRSFDWLSNDSEVYDWFWSLPCYERLLQVHDSVDGTWLAGAIQYLIASDGIGHRVSLHEVIDLLVQYFVANDFEQSISEKLERESEGPFGDNGWKECKVWWTLVVRAKEWPWIVGTLLRFLPADGCTPEVLESLDIRDLKHLLNRDNFDPKGYLFRKNVFRQSSEQELKAAALNSFECSFGDREFLEFMPIPADPPELRRKKLLEINLLEENYAGGNLAQLVAIEKLAAETRNELNELTGRSDWDWDRHIPPFAELRVKRLRLSTLVKEVVGLRVFLLSKMLVDGKEDYRGRFGYLETEIRSGIVPGSTWETYLNLAGVLNTRCSVETIGLLPVIDEFLVGGIPPLLAGAEVQDSPRTFGEFAELEASRSGGALATSKHSSLQPTLNELNQRLLSLERMSLSSQRMLLLSACMLTGILWLLWQKGCH